ncbi:FdtA/QdtA family cupin domain-containing protein [Aquimarina sp. MMG016]|uniref:sugar 3,4-ketoisomerase n=1 Tax=Aquimarina sp. MMG016 TaxID=2822690 RepID=UPI001B3A180B|nr:FdtA/QdtA family cupin domain-containing protein [Aquimarina sp. MMG016]MBQ4822195.1 WxcM-like domain-containing protein [Aquimarina sp. MMG016]
MASNTSSNKINTKTTVEDCFIIETPKIQDPRGNIAVIEKETIPFETKRVYYLYDVPSTSKRGGHAHIDLFELLIPVSGIFDVILDDGKERQKITLNKPDKGLLIVPGIWRELENFSSGSVCLVLASNVFMEEDYIRDFVDFKRFKLK